MSWNVVHYGVKRDRDENAARNILVAGGHAETKNGQVGQHKTTAKVAAACEMSNHRGSKPQEKSPCHTAREDVNSIRRLNT